METIYTYISIDSKESKKGLSLPLPFDDIINFNESTKRTLINSFETLTFYFKKSGLLDFFSTTYDENKLKDIFKISDFQETLNLNNFVSLTPNFWKIRTTPFFTISENELKSYLDVFSQTFNDLTKNTTIKKEKEQNIKNIVKDKDIKLSLYRSQKNLYDKWLGGTIDGKPFNSCGGFNTNLNRSIYSYFRFINQDYSNISDIAKINLNSLTILTNNSNVNFLTLISKIATDNNFLFMSLPVFIDYSNLEEVKNIFRPFTNLEKTSGGPSFVLMYNSGNSKYLDLGKASDHENDGYDFIDSDISSVSSSLFFIFILYLCFSYLFAFF
jgi:hypothetical protein